jgi:hypothetical protein
VLLACLLAAVLALLDIRGAWLGLGGGAEAAFACPGLQAPEVRSIPTRGLAELGAPLTRIMPTRVGRVYERGLIATGNLWSDDEPREPPAGRSLAPAGYEVRWWALDRDGDEDDVAADVLELATAREAERTLALAASPRCRRYGVARAVRYPAGAREVFWVNPDDALEWDVMFVRGRRLYRVGDVPPEYLLTTTEPWQRRLERSRDAGTAKALACALPEAGCPPDAGTLHETSLAPLPDGSPRAIATPTAAQAALYAHAVNLRPYHLPGMTQVGPEGPLEDHSYWGAFARCTGRLHSVRAIAAIHSPIFRYTGHGYDEAVYSVVAVLPSSALAARYVGVLASAHARACVAGDYTQQLAHAARATIAARALPTPVPRSYRGPGAYRAAALRLKLHAAPARRGRAGATLYVQGFVFADGRAVVELISFTSAHPFSQAEEHFLETVLVGRAEANEALLSAAVVSKSSRSISPMVHSWPTALSAARSRQQTASPRPPSPPSARACSRRA